MPAKNGKGKNAQGHYTVEEKFKGGGVVHFKTSQYNQTVGWAVDKSKPEGYVLLGNQHWPEHILNKVREAVRKHLEK